MTITLRYTKGSELTWLEGDANFSELDSRAPTTAQLATLVASQPAGGILWANRVVAAAAGTLQWFTDIGPAGSLWKSDGTNYVPTGPVFLYHSTTQVVGVAQTANQQLGVTTGIPRSVLVGCRYISLSGVLSKSGTVDIVSTLMYLGPLGTSSDGSVYGSGSFIAINRQFSFGTLLRWNAATSKIQSFVAGQNIALETVLTGTATYPANQSGALTDVNQFVSLAVTCNVGTDVPTLERFTVIGY